MFGQEMRIPLELVLPSPEEEEGNTQKDGEDTLDQVVNPSCQGELRMSEGTGWGAQPDLFPMRSLGIPSETPWLG